MITVYDEIKRRFPELDNEITRKKRDLPYMQMFYVAAWLQAMPREAITASVVERLRSFRAWCEEQPRTQSAKDDIYIPSSQLASGSPCSLRIRLDF